MRTFVLFCLCLWLLSPNAAAADQSHYWPQWRGPTGNGVGLHADPPIEWSEDRNVAWKVPIPGKGSSSPIVWGDYVFITSAVTTGSAPPAPPAEGGRRRRSVPTSPHEFIVFALDRHSGEALWRKTLRKETPHEGTHPTGTWASNSAVTDGERLYAYFGSRGLYCLDFDGNLLWEKDFGDMAKIRSFGEGSSPALHEDKILVLWDQEGPSYLYALDKMTGDELWKANRDEITSWSTPLVMDTPGGKQVITNATNRIRSYNFETGELIWECSGMTRNVIPSPVALDGVVYLMSGFRGNALRAVRVADARGKIDDSNAIVWTLERDTPYTPSPLLYETTLYFLKRNDSILSAHDARTGEKFYGPERLENLRSVYSSPVAAAGRIYISDREGNTVVLRHGKQLEVLATNHLDDGFDASLAIVGDRIYMRGQENLYCIANQ